MTTGLFALGGVLGQSARVYMTAIVLEVLLYEELGAVERATGVPPLASAVAAITLVALVWTWLGGIATVVWTDVVLFLLFLGGIAAILATVGARVEDGLAGALRTGAEAGKLQWIDTRFDLRANYTLWAALFAASWGLVGPYGCDQLMVQRLFCCRDARAARRAILASTAAVLVVLAMGLVGVALYGYTREVPLSGTAEALVAEKPDRVLPVFVTTVMGSPWKGLVVAGVFAAAISSLDSILAALSQTTYAALVEPRRRRHLARRGEQPSGEDEARWAVRVSRGLVLLAAVVLGAGAVGIELVARRYDSVLDLALAMAGYTGGALLAAFFLAFLPLRPRPRGLAWSAPLSVLAVFAVVWHAPWAQAVCAAYGAGALSVWFARGGGRDVRASVALVLGVALLQVVVAGSFVPGWPYYVPIGSAVAFVFALLLDRGDEPTGATLPAGSPPPAG